MCGCRCGLSGQGTPKVRRLLTLGYGAGTPVHVHACGGRRAAEVAADLFKGPPFYLAEIGRVSLAVRQVSDGIHDCPGSDNVLQQGTGR